MLSCGHQLTGGLQCPQAGLSLAKVAPMSAFLFLAIMYREILMDLGDVDGDRCVGVWTLPVVMGRGPALIIGLALLSIAACLAASSACFGAGLAGMVSP